METRLTIPEALELAARQLDQGAWQFAEEICRGILQVAPNHSEAEFYLGKALEAQGRHQDALISHERTLWLRPVFRWHVIQAAITWNCAQTYLEIGLGDLENFFRITAPRMFGVEPVPLSGPILFKAERRGAQIFPLTSDAFFASNAGLFQNGGIDVAFVDGLHTHEQSIRDVYHCLAHLNPGGVILLHDCNPTTESMALPASSYGEGLAKKPPGSSVEWTGDVWKTLVQLRLCDNSLDVGCLDCDYGVGVIVKRPSGRITSMAPEVIRSWTYSELEANRQDLLGLRPPHQLLDMLPQGMRNAQSPLTL